MAGRSRTIPESLSGRQVSHHTQARPRPHRDHRGASVRQILGSPHRGDRAAGVARGARLRRLVHPEAAETQ
jgi:hypothetical protein